jgi:hypothetical protein
MFRMNINDFMVCRSKSVQESRIKTIWLPRKNTLFVSSEEMVVDTDIISPHVLVLLLTVPIFLYTMFW